MPALRYSFPFLFLATVPLGFVLGGAWSFLTVVIMPLAIAGLDGTLGSEGASAPASQVRGYRLLPRLYVVLQVATGVWAAYAVSSPAVPFVQAAGLTLSVGFTAGVFGFIAAHEMVHSPSAGERALGLSLLATVGYMQFRISHVHGHHVRAATAQDPATARRGESVYAFIVRSATGQLREAWAFEAKRLRRQGREVLGPGNRLLWYFAIEGLVAAAAAALGPAALAFTIGQAVVAIFLLEVFNYVAHYGIVRRTTPSGRPERLAARHSWNSARRMNNWSLFNMGRHSDHHRRPTRAYQQLEAMPDARELPSGYAGAILLALAPPLWRRVMDPRLDLGASPHAALKP